MMGGLKYQGHLPPVFTLNDLLSVEKAWGVDLKLILGAAASTR